MSPSPPLPTLFPYTTLFRSIAKGQKINGFRKGKPLPANVAKRMFGKQARLEAVYQQMQQAFFEAIQKEEVKLARSEEHTSELQSRPHLVCRLLLEKKK